MTNTLTDAQKLDEIQRGIVDLRDALESASAMIAALKADRLAAINEADAYRRERDDLVTALRGILGECTNPRAVYGKRVNEMCRVALLPYGEVE